MSQPQLPETISTVEEEKTKKSKPRIKMVTKKDSDIEITCDEEFWIFFLLFVLIIAHNVHILRSLCLKNYTQYMNSGFDGTNLSCHVIMEQQQQELHIIFNMLAQTPIKF